MNFEDLVSRNANWLINLAGSIEQVYNLVTGAAYIMGLAFAFKALYALKVYGEARTMMATNASLKEPLTYLLVGAIFIYFPTGLALLMNTTFGYSNVLAYTSLNSVFSFSASNGGYALLKLLQLIGIIAFVRGWVMLARGAGQGAQPGSFAKGMIHIFGGVLLINIIGTINLIYNTIGISF